MFNNHGHCTHKQIHNLLLKEREVVTNLITCTKNKPDSTVTFSRGDGFDITVFPKYGVLELILLMIILTIKHGIPYYDASSRIAKVLQRTGLS